MILYPAIDLLKGQCVRLMRGDFNQVTVYSDDPLKTALSFADAGAPWLHLVDLEASRTGSPVETLLIQRIIREGGLKVQLGGGIRTLAQAQKWHALGVHRVVLGSAAFDTPTVTQSIVESLGGDAVVLALDVKGSLSQGLQSLRLATQGWTVDHSADLAQLLSDYLKWGGQYVLSTEIARDGALTGPSTSLLSLLKTEFPKLSLIASGGIRTVADLKEVKSLGVEGAIVGRALYEGTLSLKEALLC